MATWTRTELETAYPDGTVNIQNDNELRAMTSEEWSAWIDEQVGKDKPEEEPPA
jgi:hypothetical protein